MTLDPQVAPILEMMTNLGLPPFDEMTVEQARAMGGSMALGAPPDVARVADATVPGPAGPIPIRIYHPTDGDDQPVVVYYHGGGWVIGSIEGMDATCRELANESGCAVVSVEYRLAPEHRFPAAADDAYAAAAWVAAHGAEIGVDGSRLAVAGDSAGGNLAAVVALMARESGDFDIAFQALIYPVTDRDFDRPSMIENADGYLLTRGSMVWFWDHYLGTDGDASDWKASPLRAEDLSRLPPALVLTAGFDPLRDEGEAYASALKEAGVDVTAKCFPGLIHGFFQMTAMVDEAKVAMADVADALRRHLRTSTA